MPGGWVASPDNIEKIAMEILNMNFQESPMFIMHLLGNSTFRYEQVYGSFSLPYKCGGFTTSMGM
jgi:hypothetical protein